MGSETEMERLRRELAGLRKRYEAQITLNEELAAELDDAETEMAVWDEERRQEDVNQWRIAAWALFWIVVGVSLGQVLWTLWH